MNKQGARAIYMLLGGASVMPPVDPVDPCPDFIRLAPTGAHLSLPDTIVAIAPTGAALHICREVI